MSCFSQFGANLGHVSNVDSRQLTPRYSPEVCSSDDWRPASALPSLTGLPITSNSQLRGASLNEPKNDRDLSYKVIGSGVRGSCSWAAKRRSWRCRSFGFLRG